MPYVALSNCLLYLAIKKLRFFLEVAYKGTAYHGWQIQKNAISVQEVINNVLSTILSDNIETIGSGRTDTGVHAEKQVLHLDSKKNLLEGIYLNKLNKMLPKDISVKAIKRVKDDAHARFDAVSRSYEYRIVVNKDPFLEDLSYFLSKELDIDGMNKAATVLLGKKDFESFSRVKTDVRTFFCNITKAVWIRKNDNLTFYVSADRFLRGMVRAIVGTMIDVGLHKLTIRDFEDIIESKDRRNAGSAAPAHGLFFTKVEYPNDIFLD